MFAWMLTTAAMACDEPVTAAQIAELLGQATQAYRDLDIDAFTQRVDGLREALPCASGPLDPPLVARIHRIQALRAFGDREDWAAGAFAAARAIEPTYAFPTDLIPAAHPVRDLYRATSVTPGSTTDVEKPASGEVRIDGSPASTAALDRPVLFQWLPTEAPPQTAYLLPPIQLPPYPVAPPPPEPEPIAVPEPPSPAPSPRRKGPRRILFGTATAVSAITAGTAWTMSATSHARFQNESTPDADLVGLKKTTNTATTVAAIAGGATVILGTVTVVTW